VQRVVTRVLDSIKADPGIIERATKAAETEPESLMEVDEEATEGVRCDPLCNIMAQERNMIKLKKDNQKTWNKDRKTILKEVNDVLKMPAVVSKKVFAETMKGTAKSDKTARKWDGKIIKSQQKSLKFRQEVLSNRARNLIASTGLTDYVNSDLTASTQEFADKTEEDIGKFEEDLESKMSDLQAHGADVQEDVVKMQEGQTEGIQEADEEISEFEKNVQGEAKDVAGAQKEVANLEKAARKMLKNTEKIVSTNVNKVNIAAANYPMQLAADIMSAQQNANKGALKVEANVDKEMVNVDKEMTKVVSEGTKAMAAKQTESKNIAQEIANTLEGSRVEVQKQVAATYEETLKIELGEEAKLETIQEQTEGAKDGSEKVDSDLQMSLEDNADTDLNKLKDAYGDFVQEKDKVNTKTRNEIAKMKQNINLDLSTKDEEVRGESDEKIKEFQDTMRSGVETVSEASGVLSDEMSDINAQVAMNRKNIDKDASRFAVIVNNAKSARNEVDQNFNETRDRSIEGIQDVYNKFKNDVETSEAQIMSMSKEAIGSTLGAVASVRDQALQKVGKVKEQTAEKLQKVDRAIQGGTKTLDRDLNSLAVAIRDVEQESASMDKEFTDTENTMNAVDAEVNAGVKKEKAGLAETSDAVGKEVAAGSKDVQDSTAKELSELTAREAEAMKTQLDRENEVVAAVQGGSQELTTGADKDYLEAKDSRGKLSQSIQASIADADKQIQTNEGAGQQLADSMRKTTKLITDNNKVEEMAQRELAGRLKTSISKNFDDALKAANKQTDAQTKKMGEGLRDLSSEGSVAIAGDETKLKEYMAGTQQQLNDLDGKIKGAGFIGKKIQMGVEAAASQYTGKMGALSKNEKELETKSKEDLADQRSLLAKKNEQLDVDAQAMVEEFSRQQMENLRAMDRERASMFAEQQTRTGLGNQKLESSETHWGDRMAGQIEGMDKSGAHTQSNLHSLEQLEAGSEKWLIRESGSLDTAIEIGGQKLDAAIQSEEKVNNAGANGQVGGLEVLRGGFAKTSGGAEKEIDKMNGDFKDELEYYKQSGEGASHEITAKIAEMDGSAVDLAKQFVDETSNKKKELFASEERYGKQIEASDTQISGFHEKLFAIRKDREKQAVTIHDETSTFKRESLDEMEHNLDEIGIFKKKTGAKFAELEKMQVDFDRGLASVSQFESNHDEDAIRKVINSAFELEQGHRRLLDWQKSFKHRTIAWRMEVERGLGRLDGDIEDEERQQNEARINEELNANGAMRSTQRGVEDDMANAAKDESGRMSKLVDGMQEQMGAVVNGENGANGQDSAGLDRLGSSLHATEENERSMMANIHNGQVKAQEESALYRERMASQAATIDNQLLLQKQGVSPQNLRLEAETKSLETRLNQWGSLIETGEVDTDAKSWDDEAKALQSYNAELLRENSQLKNVDDKLDQKVSLIQQAISRMVGT